MGNPTVSEAAGISVGPAEICKILCVRISDAPSRWLAAGQDEGPQAGLVDDAGFLLATDGIHNTDVIFFIVIACAYPP